MKSVDIERLLSWAYIDELPKQAVAAPVSGGFFAGFSALGTVIDRGFNREPGFPVAAGPPHPDALVIAEAVEGLAPVAVEWAESREWIMDRWAPLVDPQDRRLSLMTIDVKAVVIRSAIFRQGPDWGRDRTEWPTPKRIIGRNGKPIVEGMDGSRNYRQGSYCPVHYQPDPREIAEERIEYVAWRESLVLLVQELAGCLTEHVATGPVSPERPWLEGETHSRIIHVLPAWPQPEPRRGRRRKRASVSAS